MVTNPKVIAELKEVAAEHGGVLLPEHVVERARSERSPLHSWFTWDDTEAAQKWRIEQARDLLRVTVTYIGEDEEKRDPVRVFVSLKGDREVGGYRLMASVLSQKDYRDALLADALDEMKTFQAKYRNLMELSEVFTAMKTVRDQLRSA